MTTIPHAVRDPAESPAHDSRLGRCRIRLPEAPLIFHEQRRSLSLMRHRTFHRSSEARHARAKLETRRGISSSLTCWRTLHTRTSRTPPFTDPLACGCDAVPAIISEGGSTSRYLFIRGLWPITMDTDSNTARNWRMVLLRQVGH